MIKLVATDIDGTILPYHSDFTKEVKTCIKNLEKNGVKVILVTGRMHSSTVPISDILELKNPIISYQGGLIKDYDGKTIYQAQLNPETAKEVIKWGRENNVHLNLYIDDRLYVEQDDEIIKSYIVGKYVNYTVCNFDTLELKNINKLLAIDIYDAQKVYNWEQTLKEKFPQLYIVRSTPYYCEIGSKEAKKSLAVEYLCKQLGINSSEVLTIGDQNNDIDLVKCGAIGVAMGNATQELKDCADYVTDTVENNGFVKAVEKFIEAINV